jgi:hypothetical protein
MMSKIYAVMGIVVALLLVVAGVWGWGAAAELAVKADNQRLAAWAVRCGSIAAFAAAQVLGLTFLVDLIYTRDRAGEAMRLAAGLLCTAAVVGALALGLVSK